MSDTTYPVFEPPERLLVDPVICAECGRQVSHAQIADECELCGSPRCRACADAAQTTPYICSSCAADD
ncbi:MAG: hypothetical protein KGO05_08525 [Chloroflexota bacterium]|nr:hypothetical protein [Chloroflexota bacterium]